MLAVIKTGGKQYKVTENQRLRIEKLPASSRDGSKVTFSEVLLAADEKGLVSVGAPTVANATVEAEIIDDGRAEKIRVVKYKPKIRYKKVTGHRQPFTEVRIEKIVV